MRTNSELKNLVLAHTNQPDPSLKLHTFYQERLQRQSLLLKAVQRFPRRLLQDFYVNSLKSYQFILAARENTKSLAISWISIQGALTRELAKRLNWGDEIFYLSSLEIKSLLAEHNSQGSLQQEAIYRRKIWQELKRLPLPNQIYANNISELGKFKKPQQERTRLAGTQISGGHIQGRAVLIDSNTDFFVLSKKDILVMPFAEASKSSWMSLAGGLIMEQGGQLSHTALLARERAVPALVGVKEACQQLRTGDLIELDANNCEVRVLERNYYDQHSP
jgi:pyruvate,water dikinase